MSFFEDWIEDGACCASCCQFIGGDVGFIRYCDECAPDHEPANAGPKVGSVGGKTKSQARNAARKRAKERKRRAARMAK